MNNKTLLLRTIASFTLALAPFLAYAQGTLRIAMTASDIPTTTATLLMSVTPRRRLPWPSSRTVAARSTRSS